MSSGGVNRSAVGNSTNQQLNTIATGGNQFNDQLQGILGSTQTSGLSGAGEAANTGFSNLAATGGYNPSQISALKDEGSEAARSSYQTGSDAYSRALAASGGYGASGDATANLARQGSQAASTAAVSTDANIAQNQIQNQLAGLSGQAGLYGLNQGVMLNLLNTMLGNKSATNAATNQTLGLQQGLALAPGNAQIATGDVLSALGDAASAYASYKR